MKLLWRSSFLFCLRNLYTLGNEKILELAILCCHSRSMVPILFRFVFCVHQNLTIR
ncbi:hypothetical protein BDA96_02G043700 [Sorghum bicolor]|uniref:Uncharacterized protein n=1 Tax=Sorghum bicolor TaxID=4558 RepID=A0A921RKA7_SORBI|nr:hypothetical protein BDA96_02G043700 [Sorghum bicolor]